MIQTQTLSHLSNVLGEAKPAFSVFFSAIATMEKAMITTTISATSHLFMKICQLLKEKLKLLNSEATAKRTLIRSRLTLPTFTAI